jgi:hypothetical protein
MNIINGVKLFSGLLVILLLTSCTDFFINELDIPRQELDNQLVIHGFVNDTDDSIEFVVGRNWSIDEELNDQQSKISNAKIEIFQGGVLKHEIEQNSKGKYIKKLGSLVGGAGDDWRVVVTHPDYDQAIINTEMPKMVMPKSVKFIKGYDFGGAGQFEDANAIEIVIEDPGDEENYYEVRVLTVVVSQEELILGTDTFYVETYYPDNYFSDDPIVERGTSGVLIPDDSFNGKERVFYIVMTGQKIEDIPVDKLRVEWNCVSKDHFQYSKSLQKYQRSSNFGFFAEPIGIYTNVENGLGLVSFKSSRLLTVSE